MAVARGNASSEAAERKLYIGVASVGLVGFNPTKDGLSHIYNRDIENDPEYIKDVEIEGVSYNTARLDFIIKTDAERNSGIDTILRASYTLRNAPMTNSEKTKVQVIDKYGRTAWVTNEQAANHEIPMYSSGLANIDKDYRVAYVGEEKLTNFIRAFLNIPNAMKYVNKAWVMIDKPENAEVRLDHIDEYFKGNFNEIKEYLSYQPENKVKLAIGVTTTEDNKTYQAVFTDMPLKNGVNDYSRLDKAITERQNAGGYPNTVFKTCELTEYTITPDPTPEETTASAPAKWFKK